jgi:hypothetical protein
MGVTMRVSLEAQFPIPHRKGEMRKALMCFLVFYSTIPFQGVGKGLGEWIRSSQPLKKKKKKHITEKKEQVKEGVTP